MSKSRRLEIYELSKFDPLIHVHLMQMYRDKSDYTSALESIVISMAERHVSVTQNLEDCLANRIPPVILVQQEKSDEVTDQARQSTASA